MTTQTIDSLGHRVAGSARIVIEGLILAGLIYLISSVQEQKIAMAAIQATNTVNAATLSTIPMLAIRMAEVEKDLDEHTRDINENKDDIRALEGRIPRRVAQKKQDGFSL